MPKTSRSTAKASEAEDRATKRPRRESAKEKDEPAASAESDTSVVKIGGKDVKVRKMSAAEVRAAGKKAAPPSEGATVAKKTGKPKPSEGAPGRVVDFGGAKLELPASWDDALGDQLEQPYFKALQEFMGAEVKAKKTIFPPLDMAFNALKLCPLDNVNVVVVGQDPYHGPGQAHGLSFSVMPPVPPPPSLKNMFKELVQDPGVSFKIPTPAHGNLEAWAEQGVLMLNAVLTVRQAEPNSHKGKGWEKFTDAVIAAVNERRDGVVFFLWGADAQKKCKGVDSKKHKLLIGPHPSPLSASRGFFGCKHFSLCNEYLQSKGKPAIDWQL